MNEQPILVIVENMDEDKMMELATGAKKFGKRSNWISTIFAVVILLVLHFVVWPTNHWISLVVGLVIIAVIHVILHVRHKKKPVNIHGTTAFFEHHIHEVSSRNGMVLVNRQKSYEKIKLAVEKHDTFHIKYGNVLNKNVLHKTHLSDEQISVLRDLLVRKLGDKFKEMT